MSGEIGGGVAAASPPLVYPDISCSVGGTVVFAPGDLSYEGTATLSKVSSTEASYNLTGCSGGRNTGPTGSSANLLVAGRNTKCPAVATNAPPTFGCARPYYLTGQSSSFFGNPTFSNLEKGIKKLVPWSAEGFVFKAKAVAASEVFPGGACGSGVGFEVQGTVKSSVKTTYNSGTLLACLTTDGGTGISGNFFADLAAMVGGDSSISIGSATIGGASSLTITHP